jgi:hypothetical protein
MKQADLIEDIAEILRKVNIKLLARELEVPLTEVGNHLKELVRTIIKEIAPGVFVVPYTGKRVLQSFIQEYNLRILREWVRGSEVKSSDSEFV